jgi:hypothetical protein
LLFKSAAYDCIWPIPPIQDTQIVGYQIAALRNIADSRPTVSRIGTNGQQRSEDIAEQIIHARISRHHCQFTWNTFWVQIFLNIPENGFEKCLLGAPFKSKIMVFIRMIFIKELILYLLFSAPSCNNRLTLF